MSKDLERFSATLAYIENHLFEDIILKDLAKKVLLSEYTFHRFFTYLTGFSFSTYLRNRRLSEAVDLLRQEIPIDEVSDLCGYANRSAFNRAFSNFMVSHQARQNRFMQRSISFRRFVWISRLTAVKH